jgi:hypothetical protein
MPVTPALGRLKLEYHEFEASPSYHSETLSPKQKERKKEKDTGWPNIHKLFHTP